LRVLRLGTGFDESLEIVWDGGRFTLCRRRGDRTLVASSSNFRDVHAACTRWAFRLDGGTAARAKPGWCGFDGTLAWRIADRP
jgi:hypothetical protein